MRWKTGGGGCSSHLREAGRGGVCSGEDQTVGTTAGGCVEDECEGHSELCPIGLGCSGSLFEWRQGAGTGLF